MTVDPLVLASFLQAFVSSTYLNNGVTSTDEVNLLGRTYSQNCSHYSKSTSELDLYFTDSVMANFKSIELLYGFGGSDQRVIGGNPTREDYDWKDHSSTPLQLIGRGVWNAKIQKDVHFRSSEHFYNTVQFVFKILTRDNREIFEKGSPSAQGFFTAKLPPVSTCAEYPTSLPPFGMLEIKSVDRN